MSAYAEEYRRSLDDRDRFWLDAARTAQDGVDASNCLAYRHADVQDLIGACFQRRDTILCAIAGSGPDDARHGMQAAQAQKGFDAFRG